jgi:hypothetical protein
MPFQPKPPKAYCYYGCEKNVYIATTEVANEYATAIINKFQGIKWYTMD